MEDIDGISATVFQQYEAVRQSGLTNMFDRRNVKQIAEMWGSDDLLESIQGGKYGKILENYGAAVDAGIIKRDG